MSVQKATPDILDRGRKNSLLAHSLARLGHGAEAGIDWDDAYLSHPDAMVRERALGAAHRLGALSDDRLVEALSDPAQRVRLRALRIAATLGDGDGDGDSDGQCDRDRDRGGRHGTDQVATGEQPPSASAGREALCERIVSLVSDPDELVGEAALFALGELITTQSNHLDIIERAATSNDSALVREAAVAALGSIGAQRSLAAVLAACNDKATVRRRATIALAAFDGPEVERALEAASRDRDWQVRDIARALHTMDDAGPDA